MNARSIAVLAFAHGFAVQCPLAQTPGCEPVWQAANALPGADHVHDSIAWDPDGPGPLEEHIVITGRAGYSFATFQGYAGSLDHWGLAMFRPSTGQWSTLGSSAPWIGLPATIRLAVDSNNRLHVCTDHAIYRWQGSSWLNIAQVTGFIFSLVPGVNGDLFAAGNFDQIGGIAAASIARFDGNSWHALGQGLEPSCRSVVVRPNGNVFAYGQFSQAGGAAIAAVAEWNGSSWSAVGNQSFLTAFHASNLPNGDIILHDILTGLNRWDGTSWTALGFAASSNIQDMLVRANGDIVVCGNFISMGGTACRHIASWDGTTWSNLAGGFDTAPAVALANMANGDLVAAGAMQNAGGNAAVSVARWDDTAWHGLGSGFNGAVYSLRHLKNGDVLATGAFTGLATANGTPANRIARFDGTSWHAYGDGLNSTVRDVVELPNGELVAVGDFVKSGANPILHIARWNGSAWTQLGAGGEANVHAVELLPNGDIVVAGFSWVIGGFSSNHIARWDGTSWHDLAGGANIGVEALAVMPNGDLIAGGPFTTMGGVAHNGIARWDGTAWHAMANGTGPTYALHVDANGTLFASSLQTLWQWTGSSWLALGPNGGPFYSSIRGFATLPNGQLITGTEYAPTVLPNTPFPASSNVQRNTVGIANSQTSLVHLARGGVTSLLWQPDGSLLVGGYFHGFYTGPSANTFEVSPYLARIVPTCPATAVAVGAGCIGPAGATQLRPQNAPWIASSFRATASGLPTNSIAVNMLGTNSVAMPLPIPGPSGCLLWTSPLLLQVLPTTAGQATTTLVVPNLAGLVGQQMHQQVAALTVHVGNLTAVTTNALQLTFGAL